jgi:hypothetical protein
VLAYSAEEAERLRHRNNIGPEYVLLGLLREEKCLVANLLRERGLSIVYVRQELEARGGDSSDSLGKVLQSTLLTYLESFPNQLSVLATESGICVRPNRLPAPPPFLFIEILSPTERLRDLRQRVDEHLSMGLRYVWLFDAGTRHVYVATPAAGPQEFRGKVLRTENPALELPLAEVFA